MIGALLLILAATAAPDDCSCVRAFDAMNERIESSYLAFHLDAAARARYERARTPARARALRTAPSACYRVLQDLVAEFHDGHIFISESPKLSDEEKAALAATAARIEWDEARARRYFAERGRRLDAIEGIWYAADGSRYAIVRKPRGPRNEFVAFVLTTSFADWKPGDVKATFTRFSDGSYDVTYFTRSRAAVHPALYARDQRGATGVRNGILLHMPPHTWGREGSPLLDPKNPRAPTFRMHDARTAVFFIPSHSPEHREALDALIEKHRAEILRAQTLIIDIRGDEGGSSTMTQGLEPFYRSPLRGPRTPDRTVVLASDANIEIFKPMTEQGWPAKELIGRMQANLGKVVPLSITAEEPEPETSDILPSPKQVALVIDSAVVSAGEAFTAMARSSSKVTVFGDNTGGMIDYQTVRGWLALGCARFGLFLGYPIMAASPDLPKGAINPTGMPPDVRIPRGVDPIPFIAGYYARQRTGAPAD